MSSLERLCGPILDSISYAEAGVKIQCLLVYAGLSAAQCARAMNLCVNETDLRILFVQLTRGLAAPSSRMIQALQRTFEREIRIARDTIPQWYGYAGNIDALYLPNELEEALRKEPRSQLQLDGELWRKATRVHSYDLFGVEYGYDENTRNVKVMPKEPQAELVRKVFDACMRTEFKEMSTLIYDWMCTYTGIEAKDLASSILTNRRYLPGEGAGIISDEQFGAAQRVLRRSGGSLRGQNNNAEQTLPQDAIVLPERLTRNTRIGLHQSGPPPYGYERLRNINGDDGEGSQIFVKNTGEAQIVVNIFKKYLQTGRLSAVVKYLEEQQIRTRRGSAWVSSSVSAILRNEAYTGQVQDGTSNVSIRFVPLIDASTFASAQDRLRANDTRRRIRSA